MAKGSTRKPQGKGGRVRGGDDAPAPGLSWAARNALRRLANRTFGHERFTQDGPIRPGVWMDFWEELAKRRPNAQAGDSAAADGPMIDLIITPKEGTDAGLVAVAIERLLAEAGEHRAFRAARNLSYSRTSVYARLTPAEVLKAIVPFTAWWTSALKGSDAQSKLKSRDGRAEAQPPPSTRSAGEFYQRFQTLLSAMQPGSGPASIDRMIIEEHASFSFYRFSILASLTIYWINEHPTLPKILRLAETLSGDRVTVADLEVLIPSFQKVTKLIDDGAGFIAAARERTAGPPEAGRTARTQADTSFCQRLHSEPFEIISVSPNRVGMICVTASRNTIKADAAQNVFRLDMSDIAWAVLDSGIDATHPAFADRRRGDGAPVSDITTCLRTSRVIATYDLTYIRELLSNGALPDHHPDEGADPVIADKWAAFRRHVAEQHSAALAGFQQRRDAGLPIDWDLIKPLVTVPKHVDHYRVPKNEHGTHVAGIMAANWPESVARAQNVDFEELVGVCPDLELIDVRVFGDSGESSEDRLTHALEFIGHLNRRSVNRKAVHGVNVSAAFGYTASLEGCGQTQVCLACNALVNSGVVVVAAAGNFGFAGDKDAVSLNQTYRDISITDPGNADLVITVGSTHRLAPHTYGVSYFSSRGPTADGRMKPDIVAPGEKVLSSIPGGGIKALDGTSMAAPHVSAVAAMLMARHRELIGQPQRIKEILCRTATSLGRVPEFQGAGLVDALRALQSV